MTAEITEGKLHCGNMTIPVNELRGVEARRNGLGWFWLLLCLGGFLIAVSLLAEGNNAYRGGVVLGMIFGGIWESKGWTLMVHTVHQTYSWKTSKAKARQAQRNISHAMTRP